MTAPPPRVASALSNTHIAARKAEREALARDLAAKLPSHRPVTKATSSGVGQQQGPPLPHRASVTTLSSGPSSFRGDTRRPSLATNGASSNPSSFLLPPQVAATAHNEGLTTTTLSVSSRPASVSGTSSQQGGGASYAAKAHEKAMAAKVLSSSFASAGRGGRGSEAGSEFGDQQQPNDAVGTFGALYSSMRSVTSSVGGGGIAPSSPLKRRQSTRRQSAAWMDDEDSVLFDDEPIQAEVVIQLKNGAPRKGEGTSRISKSVSHGASMMRRASSTRGILPSPSSSPSRQHQRTSSNNSNNNNNNNSLQLDPQEEVSILKARVRYLEAKQQRKDTTQLEGIVGRGGSDFCPPGLLVDPRTGRRFCRLASFPLHTDAPPPWSLPWNSHLLENSLNPLTSASAASAPPLLSFEHLSDAAAEVGVQQQQSSVPRRGTHLVQSSTPHSPDVYEPPTPSGALAATAKRTQSGVLINQAESTDVAEGAESPLSNSTARSLSFLLRSPNGGVSTAAAGPPAYVLPPAILLTNHNNSSKSSSARRGGSPNQVPRSTSPDAHDSAVVRNIHSSSLKPSLQKSDDGENSFMELRGEESASSPAWSDHHNYFHPTDKQQPLTSLPHVAHSSPPKRSGRSVDDPTFGPRKRSVFFANGEGVDLVSPAAHPASPSLAAPSPSYYATTGGPLIRFEALASPDASEGAAGGDGAAAETSLFTPSFGPATHTAGSSSTNSTTNTGGGATTSSSPPLISRGAEEQKDTAGVVHRRGAALHGAPSPQEGTTFRGRRLNSFWEPSGDMDGGDEGSPRSGSPGYFTLPSAANAPVVVPSPAAAPAPIALSETVSFYSMNVRRKAPQAAASTSIQQKQPQLQQQQKVLQLEPHVMTVTAPTPPSRSPPPSTATTLQPPSSPPPSSNARAVNGPQQSTTTTGRQSEASRIEALFPAAPETAAPSSTTASNTTTTARTSGASSTPSAPSVQLLQRALQQAQREAEGKESNNSNNNCTPVEMEQVCRFVVPAEMQSGFELMDRTRRAQLLEKRIKAVLSRRSK